MKYRFVPAFVALAATCLLVNSGFSNDHDKCPPGPCPDTVINSARKICIQVVQPEVTVVQAKACNSCVQPAIQRCGHWLHQRHHVFQHFAPMTVAPSTAATFAAPTFVQPTFAFQSQAMTFAQPFQAMTFAQPFQSRR